MHVLSEISMTTTNHAFVHSFVFGQCGSNTNAIFEIDYFCSPYSSYLFRGPASLIFFAFAVCSCANLGSVMVLELHDCGFPKDTKQEGQKIKLKTKQHWKPTLLKIIFDFLTLHLYAMVRQPIMAQGVRPNKSITNA